jgi:hypothetical protein
VVGFDTPPILIKPQSDEYSPGVFSRYADIVKAAEYLEVPDRDVAEKVMKRMKNMARQQREEDRRVSFEELGKLHALRSASY